MTLQEEVCQTLKHWRRLAKAEPRQWNPPPLKPPAPSSYRYTDEQCSRILEVVNPLAKVLQIHPRHRPKHINEALGALATEIFSNNNSRNRKRLVQKWKHLMGLR